MDEKHSTKKPVYIGEMITVGYDQPPLLVKKPDCPNMFIWQGKSFRVTEVISEWHDFSRKGKYTRNMKDAHLERANIKGSLGVGRFYFRVRSDENRIFEIYYDRSIKNTFETSGFWVLFQELFLDNN
jgi:hypothetical protein